MQRGRPSSTYMRRCQGSPWKAPSLILGFENTMFEPPLIGIRREMRPQKGRFGVVPYVGNKLFPSFAKKRKKLKKIFYFWTKILFLKESFYFCKKIFNFFYNLMTWQFSHHVNNLRGMGIFHWNEAPKLGSSKRTRSPSLASFFF